VGLGLVCGHGAIAWAIFGAWFGFGLGLGLVLYGVSVRWLWRIDRAEARSRHVALPGPGRSRDDEAVAGRPAPSVDHVTLFLSDPATYDGDVDSSWQWSPSGYAVTRI
jgi:hypothetical protein